MGVCPPERAIFEHAPLGHGFFAGCGQNVGRAFGHGGRVFMDVHRQVDGTAEARHVDSSLKI